MTSQTRQFQYEHDTWKRVLYHMMDENAHFKIRLSEVLRSRSDKKFIDKAEQYQSRFIKFDEKIVILRAQLSTVNKMIKSDTLKGGIMDLNLSLVILRKNIISAEKELISLRKNFVTYMVKLFCDDFTPDLGSCLNKESVSLRNIEYDKQMWLAIA